MWQQDSKNSRRVTVIDMKTEKREKAVPKCQRPLDTSGRDNKVKPNASNTDETELMCHDQ